MNWFSCVPHLMHQQFVVSYCRHSWNFWNSKATTILVLGNFIKRLDFLHRVLQNSFTIWETGDLPTPKTLERTLYEFPVDNCHKAQATHFWMLIVFLEIGISFLMSASTKLARNSDVDGSILNSFFQSSWKLGSSFLAIIFWNYICSQLIIQ